MALERLRRGENISPSQWAVVALGAAAALSLLCSPPHIECGLFTCGPEPPPGGPLDMPGLIYDLGLTVLVARVAWIAAGEHVSVRRVAVAATLVPAWTVAAAVVTWSTSRLSLFAAGLPTAAAWLAAAALAIVAFVRAGPPPRERRARALTIGAGSTDRNAGA